MKLKLSNREKLFFLVLIWYLPYLLNDFVKKSLNIETTSGIIQFWIMDISTFVILPILILYFSINKYKLLNFEDIGIEKLNKKIDPNFEVIKLILLTIVSGYFIYHLYIYSYEFFRSSFKSNYLSTGFY